MSTSPTPGVPDTPSNNLSSPGRNIKQNAVLLSALEKSFLAIYTSTTPTRRTSGGTREVIVFSLTHMPTVYCPRAGERRLVFSGQGIIATQVSIKKLSIRMQAEQIPYPITPKSSIT